VARYLNGLRYEIQDELSMVTIRTVEDMYQMALRAEEKLSRKQGQRGRGRSHPRGKAIVQERTQCYHSVNFLEVEKRKYTKVTLTNHF
jgi:hypothetical protein